MALIILKLYEEGGGAHVEKLCHVFSTRKNVFSHEYIISNMYLFLFLTIICKPEEKLLEY